MDKRSAKHRYRRSDQCLAVLIRDGLFGQLDTSVARKCKSLLASGDHNSYLALEVDPSSYTKADIFKRDWLAVNLFSKYPYLSTGTDKARVAMDKFFVSEEDCRLTNHRLSVTRNTDPYLDSLIEAAKWKIDRWLGEFDIGECIDHMSFSSGATTSKRRTHGDPAYKFGQRLDTTKPLLPFARELVKSSPAWSAALAHRLGLDCNNWFRVVEGNEITTVPKNAKSDRIIAIEPDMNMFVQKGIGRVIRRKLLYVGCDLNDQTKNQRLARVGSIDGSLATLDLSAASDSIGKVLVERLLPRDWYLPIMLCRSPWGKIRSTGQRVRYEKISSMGNGYTFELESLIFYSLAQTVHDVIRGVGKISVYGDDIIVPTAEVELLTRLLEYCGFRLNQEKSFSTGPFRESCGKHYFNGLDVTPFYVREKVDTIHRTYWLANSVRRWANDDRLGICDPRYREIWTRIVNTLPHQYKIFGPCNLGDNVIHATISEVRPKVIYSHLYKVRTFLLTIGKQKRVTWSSLLPKTLSRIPSSQSIQTDEDELPFTVPSVIADVFSLNVKPPLPADHIVVEKDKQTARFIEVHLLQWECPGDWVL